MTDINFVDHSTVQLIKHNASDEDVARAAWVSNYGSEARLKDTGRIEGLIKFLYNNRHMSPFEHGSFTFFVRTPIFVAREFMRHRTASYNEVSGRYKELEPNFYVAPNDRPLVQQGKVGAYEFVPGNDEQYAIMRTQTEIAYRSAWYSYQTMLDAGVAREVARNVLPVGIMTEFYVTMNPRNVMQFLSLRNDKHALKEIRDVAIAIEEAFADAMPLTYKVYRAQRDAEADDNKVVVDLNDPEKAREQVKEIMDKLNLTVLRGAETILPLKPGGIYRYPDGYDKLPRPIFTEDDSVARAVNDGPKIDLTDDKIPNWNSNVKTNKIVTGTWKNDRPTGNATGPHLNFTINIDTPNPDPKELAKQIVSALDRIRKPDDRRKK